MRPSTTHGLLKFIEQPIRGKRVLIREDFNVPLANGVIQDDTRIRAALPTIIHALTQQAAVILMSHFDRPTEGQIDPALSLRPIAQHLSHLLQKPVRLVTDWQQGLSIQPGEVVLLENIRFNRGEKANDAGLAKRLADLADIFVMDAFGVAHRTQASTVGVAQQARVACAGPLLLQELQILEQAWHEPKQPLLAIVGGAKVSSKLLLLETLCKQVDTLIVGGGIANTFLAAQGVSVGSSLYEPELIDEAKRILQVASEHDCLLPLPQDVVVATQFSQTATATIRLCTDVAADEMILDIGPATVASYRQLILQAKTIVWNGPIGVFEWPTFAKGTQAVCEAVAASPAYSLAGGGDTLAAIELFGIADKLSYLSTGGGAFLTYLEGSPLPAVEVLRKGEEKNLSS